LDRPRLTCMPAIVPAVLLAAAFAVLLAAASALAQPLRAGTYISEERFPQTTFVPVEVPCEVVEVEPSQSASYFRCSSGDVYAEGNGGVGQLGDGSFASSLSTPVKVALPSGVKVAGIGENNSGVAFVTTSGRVFVAGANNSNSLCVPEVHIDTPVEVQGLSGIVYAQGGGKHMLYLTSKGTVEVCGSNNHGMLGLGEGVVGVKKPTLVPGVSGVVTLSVGGDYSDALTREGKLVFWGYNGEGQCGCGSEEDAIWTPTAVPLEHVVEVSDGGDLGNGAVLALTSAGEVLGWGNDEGGEIGNGLAGPKLSYATPQVAFELDIVHPVRVVTGGANTLGLTASGALYGVGSAEGGALGDGLEAGRIVVPELIGSGYRAVSSTARNTLALR
jgi:alpha-tubulin suppressor-like RCC1 family protein